MQPPPPPVFCYSLTVYNLISRLKNLQVNCLTKEMLQQTFVRIYTTLLLANTIGDYVTRNLHSNYRRTIDDPITSVTGPVRCFVCMSHETLRETTGDRHHTEGIFSCLLHLATNFVMVQAMTVTVRFTAAPVPH